MDCPSIAIDPTAAVMGGWYSRQREIIFEKSIPLELAGRWQRLERYTIRKYGSTFYIGIAMVILPPVPPPRSASDISIVSLHYRYSFHNYVTKLIMTDSK